MPDDEKNKFFLYYITENPYLCSKTNKRNIEL